MKIKPNTPFLKPEWFSQTHLGNPGNHNFWLLGPPSQMSEEQRVKAEMLEKKTTEVVSAPTCGLDTTNNLLELLEKGGLGQSSSRVGTHSAWSPPGVVCHMKAWPRGSPAPVRWHLPLQTTPFCLERCRGVTSVGSELVLTCREVRAGFRLFRVCWLETSAFRRVVLFPLKLHGL